MANIRPESRGNLAAGGTGEGVELSERDRWICQQVGPELKQRGLVFVGLDVIGGKLIEANVLSPGGIARINKLNRVKLQRKNFERETLPTVISDI